MAGWEFIESSDWDSFTKEISEVASKAVKAKVPKAGRYLVVANPELVGLLIHEAFGHAVEGDLVSSGSSILKNRLGERVASELVDVVDDGVVEGGCYVPYDDEGSRKIEVKVVEKGLLKSFLTHLQSSSEVKLPPTGNGRAQDFENMPMVRQTNFFILPRDYSLDELLEGVKEGIYTKGGGVGGEVDTGSGTFTFNVGPSYLIKNGEFDKLVRSTTVSGYILETLRNVEAVSRDLKILTSVFGGCGKDGQMVKDGIGGPHIRISGLSIGGM